MRRNRRTWLVAVVATIVVKLDETLFVVVLELIYPNLQLEVGAVLGGILARPITGVTVTIHFLNCAKYKEHMINVRRVGLSIKIYIYI